MATAPELNALDQAIVKVVRENPSLTPPEVTSKTLEDYAGSTTSAVRDSLLWLINREVLTLTHDRRVQVSKCDAH